LRNALYKCSTYLLTYVLTEIGSVVWGTPVNFNGFRALASLRQRRRSTDAIQTLRDIWPSPGLVHYIHLRGLFPLAEFALCKILFTSKYCVLLYWQRYCTAVKQQAPSKLCGVVQGMELRSFRGGRHLYSAGHAITLGIGSHSSFLLLCVLGLGLGLGPVLGLGLGLGLHDKTPVTF